MFEKPQTLMRSDDQVERVAPPFSGLIQVRPRGRFEYGQEIARNFEVFLVARCMEGDEYPACMTGRAFAA